MIWTHTITKQGSRFLRFNMLLPLWGCSPYNHRSDLSLALIFPNYCNRNIGNSYLSAHRKCRFKRPCSKKEWSWRGSVSFGWREYIFVGDIVCFIRGGKQKRERQAGMINVWTCLNKSFRHSTRSQKTVGTLTQLLTKCPRKVSLGLLNLSLSITWGLVSQLFLPWEIVRLIWGTMINLLKVQIVRLVLKLGFM